MNFCFSTFVLTLTLVLSTVGLNTANAANSVNAPACDVPVCDIPTKLDELKLATQNDRYQFVKKLRDENRNSAEIKTLQNLITFADEAVILFKSLQDEDWVIREAVTLADQSRTSLLKIDISNPTVLISEFDRIEDLGQRFQVLNFWATESEKLEDQAKLKSLLKFGEHAKDWAIKTKQEDYFAREAQKLLDNASRKLISIYPTHEGVYDIKIKCIECYTAVGEVKKINQLVIFDSLSDRGLVVGFGEKDAHLLHYSFTNSTIESDAITVKTGREADWAHPAESFIKVDPATGNVSGTLYDTVSKDRIEFTGKADVRAIVAFNDEGAPRTLQDSEVVGRYKGTLGSLEGELVVRQFSDKKWKASFHAASGKSIKDFSDGGFNASRGILSLTSSSNFSLVETKLNLAVRKDSKGNEVWRGSMMLTSGQPLKASFVRISDR